MARVLLALLPPLLALGLQWVFWPVLRPLVWILFYPAVFASSWIGGLVPGLTATAFSIALVWWFFLPPAFTLWKGNLNSLFAVLVFSGMGTLFSVFQEREQRTNRELERLLKKSRELDELKSQFFANVSHELRTPLALILGPARRGLADPATAPETRRDLETIERNAGLLHRHVEDLLDLAKLEGGRMEVRYARTDLAAMLRLVASHFDSRAKDDTIDFQVVAPAALEMEFDPPKVQKILFNLVGNAFKFTPPGGRITLSAGGEGESAWICVQDNGPGIPEDKREEVFERFRQLEGGADRSHEGTGLGLAIVREFAGLHGGRAEVGEAPGGGALFRVTALHLPEDLPELAPHRPASPQQRAEEARGGAPLLLVVEDNADMREFLVRSLQGDYRVETSGNGQEGLDACLARRPDLVLTDLMMPGMSGDRMIQRLRQHKDLDELPIVVLTAKADEAVRTSLLREGAQDILVKPFSVEELRARVDGLLSTRKRSGEALARSRGILEAVTRHLPGGAVLEVDPNLRLVLAGGPLLKDLGFEEAGLPGRLAEEALGPDLLPEDRLRVALAGGTASFETCAGERTVWSVCTPLRDGGGEILAALALVQDVTGLKQAEAEVRRLNTGLERRVQARTAELEAANKELESFSYSASHDLRAPLRALVQFSQALQEDFSDHCPAKAKTYLEQIHLAGLRMGELIDGLLALSQATRGELQRDRVDLSRCAEEVGAELASGDPERRVALDVQPGLTVEGDSRMLAAMMRNLLGNAWKYTREQAAAKVRVYVSITGGDAALCVADNGAGFDMTQADKLFQPFRRLHSSEQFPGLGIGLATVQRIVHRHGGRIEAEGSPGRGATFRISLPGLLPGSPEFSPGAPRTMRSS
jgi:signal transduction histidine kinase